VKAPEAVVRILSSPLERATYSEWMPTTVPLISVPSLVLTVRPAQVGKAVVLPLVVLAGSLFLFVLTPILNSFVCSQEYEADMYGLDATRQPDGAAQAAIHLGEYRKMDPGAVEEWLFYDHLSGRNRIYAAMRWKAENLRRHSGLRHELRRFFTPFEDAALGRARS